jgi:hypothetical protein
MNEEGKDFQKDDSAGKTARKLDRRDFLQGVATTPVLGLFGYALAKQRSYEKAYKAAKRGPEQATEDKAELNVALLGVGAQGSVLLNAMLKCQNLNFRAVCDIWTEYNLLRTVNLLKKYKYDVNSYEDYREMLDKEKDLDAVIIATPDFWHAQHTVDCLEAGLNVYCEKEMSNTLDEAKRMVLVAGKTGKLLQIGHQRRSHPRYLHCYYKLLKEAKILGRIVTVNGQWNRAVQPSLGFPNRYAIPADRLKKYGFKSMEQFSNWRWYKGLEAVPSLISVHTRSISITGSWKPGPSLLWPAEAPTTILKRPTSGTIR